MMISSGCVSSEHLYLTEVVVINVLPVYGFIGSCVLKLVCPFFFFFGSNLSQRSKLSGLKVHFHSNSSEAIRSWWGGGVL